MPPKVKDGKTAHIAHPIDVDRELAEKVNDRACAWWEREPKDERCEQDRQELGKENGNLHGEERTKFLVDLLRQLYHSTARYCYIPTLTTGRAYRLGMQFSFPPLWQIMRPPDDLPQTGFRIEDQILLGNQAP